MLTILLNKPAVEPLLTKTNQGEQRRGRYPNPPLDIHTTTLVCVHENMTKVYQDGLPKWRSRQTSQTEPGHGGEASALTSKVPGFSGSRSCWSKLVARGASLLFPVPSAQPGGKGEVKLHTACCVLAAGCIPITYDSPTDQPDDFPTSKVINHVEIVVCCWLFSPKIDS